MNKKGFTTIEMILTMVLVIVIMITITEVVLTYRDQNNYQETLTSILNYKNNLTTIIYNDIIDEKIIAINEIETNNKYELVKENNEKIYLTIIKENNKVGILYDDVFYQIEQSKNNLVRINQVIYQKDSINKLYSLDINFSLTTIDQIFTIHLLVS